MFAERRYLILFFLMMLSCFYRAQDVIILKNGNKLYCKIVFEDSTSVYYSKPPQKTQFEIKKSEIERFIWTNAPAHDTVLHKNKDLFLIQFSGGYSHPIDEYASMDANDIKSGLAKDGYFFKAGAVLKFSRNAGLSGYYYYQKNKLNDVPVRELLTRSYNTTFTTSASSWLSSGFLGGIYLNTALSPARELSLYTNLSFGALKHTLPAIESTGLINGTRITVTQFEDKARAFTFMGSVGVNYRSSKSLAFNLSVNYFYARPVFNDIFTSSNTGYTSYDDYTQKITTLNVEAGIEFVIGK